jgi:uncharacterized protein YeaO (DUF488 family)
MGLELKMKRIYEPPTEKDGFRILVDRLWPRGVKKEVAQLDAWLKDSAPSPDLRKWFDHDPEKFNAFKERYEEELLTNPPTAAAVAEILKQLEETDVTSGLCRAGSGDQSCRCAAGFCGESAEIAPKSR